VKVRLKYLFIYWLLTSTPVCGQLVINFKTYFENDPLVIGKKYFLKMSGDSVSVEELKFYVSNVEFLFNDAVVYKATGKYFLVDIRETNSHKIYFPGKQVIKYNRIRFSIGIDSITNTSGVLGGVLDPTKDMYWTWQSGYINLKLEGFCKSCQTKNNRYQFHIGGYQHPNKTIQVVDIVLKNNKPAIKIRSEKLLEIIDLRHTCEIMSPGEIAMDFANKIKHAFVLQE
jgi:hypothetical protein